MQETKAAMEAEMKALLADAQLLAEHRQALGGMGHPQPAAAARTGSKPAHGIIWGLIVWRVKEIVLLMYIH